MMLVVRVKSCEVGVWRDVLCRRRAEAVAAAGTTPAKSADAGLGIVAEGPHDEIFVIARVLDALCRALPEGQPRELSGPTWLLDPVIRDAASEAAERLSEEVEVFRADGVGTSADRLRSAVETVGACAATLIGLDYVQNHAVE